MVGARLLLYEEFEVDPVLLVLIARTERGHYRHDAPLHPKEAPVFVL